MLKFPGYKFNLIELSTPILMCLWGSWFLIFEPLNASGAYQRLNFLPSRLWAVIFFAVSVSKAFSIVCNTYIIRRASAAISVVLWLFMAALFAFGNYESHLLPTCLFFAYQSFLSWHRISPLTSELGV